MGKFLPNTSIIYLDQFAVSYMNDGVDSVIWKDIGAMIAEGVDRGKWIIPYSHAHLLESAQKDLQSAIQQDKMLFALSKGWHLDHEPAVNSRLLMQSIDLRPPTANVFFSKVSSPAFSISNAQKLFANLKRSFSEMSDDATGLVNMIRAAARENGQKAVLNKDDILLSRTIDVYQSDITTRLADFARTGTFARRNISLTKMTIPYWADTLIDICIQQHKLTRAAAQKIVENIEFIGIKHLVPPVYIRAVLESALAAKSQRETPNDQIDILRMATAIPASDILITDKSKCYDIKTIGLDTFYRAEVFSPGKDQLQSFKRRLADLLN